MKCCCGSVDDEPTSPEPRRRQRGSGGRRRNQDTSVDCRGNDVFAVIVQQDPPELREEPQPTTVDVRTVTPVLTPSIPIIQPQPLQPQLVPVVPSIQMGTAYLSGNIPGVMDDESIYDKDMTEEDLVAFTLAKETVQQARSMLPLGPFNNRRKLPQSVKNRDKYPDYSNALIEYVTSVAVEQITPSYPGTNAFTLGHACKAEAVKRIGGGVCSMIASMCTGLLTQTAPPGTEICQVFHDFDHEFVIMRTPGSRWFVVDPWPMNPKIIPFVDCLFKPKGVTNYFPVTVEQPAPEGQPFAIDVSTLNWDKIISDAKKEFGPTGPQYGEMASNYGHMDNVAKPDDFEGEWGGGGSGDWG